MSDIVIKVENLSKQYRLGQVGTGTISHDLNRWWHLVRGKENPYLKIGEANDCAQKAGSQYAWALKDINFEVKKGEILGIIGPNGAGKSTLLKILSRVTGPTTGTIKTKGRIASLLEVGTGFHPEMTGRENIYMNGTLMGMTRHEVTSKLDEIIEFAGVERYLDTPTKRYSSGMTVRLGFAIAAHLEPEILIVDEVLAVGDAEFQKKALGKMQDVSKGDGRTVLFVSHDLGAVNNLCNSGLLINKGSAKTFFNIEDCILEYNKNINSNKNIRIEDINKNADIFFKNISVTNSKNENKSHFTVNEKIRIQFELGIVNRRKYSLFITIKNEKNQPVFSTENFNFQNKNIILEINEKFLTRGKYSIDTFIHIPRVTQIDRKNDVCTFEVFDHESDLIIHGNYNYGNVFGNISWY